MLSSRTSADCRYFGMLSVESISFTPFTRPVKKAKLNASLPHDHHSRLPLVTPTIKSNKSAFCAESASHFAQFDYIMLPASPTNALHSNSRSGRISLREILINKKVYIL